MHNDALNEHLQTILDAMTNLPTARSSVPDFGAYRKPLANSRAAVKRAISETLLNGAKIDREPTEVFSETFKSDKKTKRLALALKSVPGLELDHTFLVRAKATVIGLITMPYHHRPGFSENGSNDLATWSTHDNLSWHLPGQTRLTIVLDKYVVEGRACQRSALI